MRQVLPTPLVGGGVDHTERGIRLGIVRVPVRPDEDGVAVPAGRQVARTIDIESLLLVPVNRIGRVARQGPDHLVGRNLEWARSSGIGGGPLPCAHATTHHCTAAPSRAGLTACPRPPPVRRPLRDLPPGAPLPAAPPVSHSAAGRPAPAAVSAGRVAAGRVAACSTLRASSRPAGRISGRPAGRIAGRPAGRAAGRPAGRTATRSALRASARPAGRIACRPPPVGFPVVPPS